MASASTDSSRKTLSWADRVSRTTVTAPRKQLKFFEPTFEDSKVIVSPPPEIEEQGSKKWENCLVGYFLDSKLPQGVVRSIMLKLWAKQGLMDAIHHGSGFYIFRFSQPSGAKEVLESGPWLISRRHIFLKWWTPGLVWQKENASKVPVWV